MYTADWPSPHTRPVLWALNIQLTFNSPLTARWFSPCLPFFPEVYYGQTNAAEAGRY
jgi:hypothetical protein